MGLACRLSALGLLLSALLDPPSPSVLNCSVTNGKIRISCAIRFSKDVRYSWYRDDRKIIQANNPVLELEENADPLEKVLCIREVSKTKINDSISLSACFPKSPKSLSRGRNGLIAFFVITIILLLFMGALFVVWKRGLLSNIRHQIPTKHSAEYKPEEQHLTDEDRFLEESGQKGVRKYQQSQPCLRSPANYTHKLCNCEPYPPMRRWLFLETLPSAGPVAQQYDGVSPGTKHCTCPVSLLARTRFLALSGAFDQSYESHQKVEMAEAKESDAFPECCTLVESRNGTEE
ncbi:blue-sensitive opsin [Platysternon megacephalum]|uniref:Blue-sensitive opsin n=1 Tax=Platysternon megacephalum TaxID=55544 RepID=A0A4D9EDW9_9SAUR|nr:blue-sensitive opsin [Platysternon megacephalum]